GAKGDKGDPGTPGRDGTFDETMEFSSLETTSKTLIPAINEVKTEIDLVKQSASSGKELVATAITGKNIATESSDTFEVMAGNIRKIKEMPAIPEDRSEER
ncbi:hypothetical protein, partial [Clostridioides difficile]|uniref:hypothetical protein n=1 Tax=Clostridioides difficile TaxID=1496 RepID=UPI001CA48E69